MSRRRAVDDEWDIHKDDILKLYVEEDKPLSEVKTTMDSQGFKRTKAQYERVLKQWNVTKNATATEWKYIVSRLKDREKDKKQSVVKVRGTLLPEHRIQKQRKRYEYRTTYERYLEPRSNPSTPPGVLIITPETSPSPIIGHVPSECREVALPMDMITDTYAPAFHETRSHQVYEQNSFPGSTGSLEINSSLKLLASWPEDGLFESNASIGLAASASASNSSTELPSGRVALTDYLSLGQGVHAFFSNPKPYTPTHTPSTNNGEFLRNPDLVFDLAEGNSYLDILKFVVTAVANNFAEDQLDKLYHWLSHDQHAQAVLARLLRQKVVSAQAFAEQLFPLAAQHGNTTLVSSLIKFGVAVNSRTSSQSSALEGAMRRGHEDIVDLLLEHGADDWYTKRVMVFDCAEGGTDVTFRSPHTVVDVAVGLGQHTVTKKLLDCEERILGCHRSASLDTLRFAVLLNRLEIVELLAQRRPQLWQLAEDQPWYLLEAAALCKDSAMLDYLLQKGFNIHATDVSGHGSALAAASAVPQMHHVERLLAAGANIDGIAFGFRQSDISPWVLSFAGLAALHIAIQARRGGLARYLLEHKANPNQLCDVYPIQLAAYKGAEDLVDLLLKSGANINSMSRKVSYHPPSNHSAIRIALNGGYLSVVRTLHTNGALLPEHRPTQPLHNRVSHLLSCTLSNSDKRTCESSWLSKNQGAVADNWDPCATAIAKFKPEELRCIMEERYMREVLSPAHLSQCITIHGTKFTEKIFQNSLLCMDSGLDLLILFSLVYAGDETMAIDLVQMRATQGCNDFLPQQYSNKALVMAARRNYLDLARTLLELGIDPFTEDSEFCPKNPWRMDIYEFVDQSRACSTGFQTACRMGRREMVKLFLAWEGSSSHPLSKQHRSLQTSAACIHAVCSGKLWLEEMLRVMGIDFHNSSQVLGSTYLRSHLRIGLQFAMNYEKVDLAKRLMDLGSDPCAAAFEDDRTFSGPWHTPLQCAARQENLDFVRKLLSMGAIPKEEPANSSGATAIQFAAIRGNFEILELLIQAGRDINAPKSAYRGRTALQGAAEHGRLDMTRHLLGLGVDVRGRDNTNYVGAVRLALYEGHRVLAQMIQDWKREQYGEEDCEDFETIKASSDLEDWDGDYLSDEEDWISGDEDEG